MAILDKIKSTIKGIFRSRRAEGDSYDQFNAFLDDMAERAMKRTDEVRELYRDALRRVFGDQIPDGLENSKDEIYAQINILLPGIWQEVAMIAANDPTLVSMPIEDTDQDLARSFGQVIQARWNGALNMRMRIIQAVLDGHLCGYYVGYTKWKDKYYWDKRQQQWIGDVDFKVINPMYFGCDPEVELSADIAKSSEYIMLEYYMDKAKAAELWPDYKKHLQETESWDGKLPYQATKIGVDDRGNSSNASRAGRIRDDFDSDGDWYGSFQHQVLTDFSQRLADMIAGAADRGDKDSYDSSRQVKIQLFWWRDYTEEQMPELKRPFSRDEIKAGVAGSLDWDDFTGRYTDRNRPIYGEDGQTVVGYNLWPDEEPMPQATAREAYGRPVYPNGRFTIRLDDEIIVEDSSWPYDNWPVHVGVNYILPHMWQGLNSVETSLYLQDVYNRVNSGILNSILRHAYPETYIEEDAPSDIHMRDGVFYKDNKPWSVTMMKPGRLNGMKKEPSPPIPTDQFEYADIIRSRQQDIFGIHDVAMGRVSKEQHTLGETKMLNQNTQLRIALQTACLYDWLSQVGYHMAELMAANYKPDRWVRYLGPGRSAQTATMKWTGGHASAKFDIKIEPGSTLPYDRADEIARYGKATEIIGPAMFRKMLEKLEIADVDEVLANHELLGPFMAFKEQMAQMGLNDQQMMAILQQAAQQVAAMTMAMGANQNGTGNQNQTNVPGGNQRQPGQVAG